MKRLATVLAAAVLASACQSPAPRAAVGTTSARIQRLLRETPLVDGHNDLMIHYHACGKDCPRGYNAYDIGGRVKGHADLPRWKIGGVGAQLLNSGWLDDEPSLDGTLKGFAFTREIAVRYPDRVAIARTSADVRAIHAQGRLAILLSLEDPERLGTDEETVRRLASEGLRADILAYNEPTALADGHAGPMTHGGLSPLGRAVVGWMQKYGILVDLSHSSVDTARDVLDIATAPVIFSHSSAAALCDVSRNVPDDVLRRIPANGGIVMVSFVPEFTGKAFADWYEGGDSYWARLMERYKGDRAKVDAAMALWERDNPMPARPVIAAVADHIVRSSLELIEESGFAEYYDPLGGEPLGGGRFTWTAAMVLEFLNAE